MPGVLPPLGNNGRLPAMWNAFAQQINSAAAIASGTATNVTRVDGIDQYQNITAVSGQLNASLTQGGGFTASGATPANTAVAGTQSATGLSGYGRAKCVYFPAATSAGNNNSNGSNTTMSVTNGSQTVTIGSGTNVTNGMGIAGYGIPAGTTITAGGGTTTLTISLAASATGTGLPCSIFSWEQI